MLVSDTTLGIEFPNRGVKVVRSATSHPVRTRRAPIRTLLRDRTNLPWWKDSLASGFSIDNPATIEEIPAAYDALGQRFRVDLYVIPHRRPAAHRAARIVTVLRRYITRWCWYILRS